MIYGIHMTAALEALYLCRRFYPWRTRQRTLRYRLAELEEILARKEKEVESM
jgi:hypothetical protein